jgi:hypothetical protein
MQGLAGRQIPMKPAFIRPSRAKFPVVAATMAASPGGCGAVIFIFWSGNNPVKYTDPDGMLTFDSSMTEDDFNTNKFSFPEEYTTWDDIQGFFRDNPNGAFYCHDSEIRLESYNDKNDIKRINPDKANVDLLKFILYTKAFFQLAKAGLKALSQYKNVDPNSLVPNPIDEFTKIEPSPTALHAARETIKNTGTISSRILVEKGSDGTLTVIIGG